MLTEKRKADRAKMAAMVQALCLETGATVEREERDREIYLGIDIGAATVGIEFDGGPAEAALLGLRFAVEWYAGELARDYCPDL